MADVATGAIARWKLNEPSGTSATDCVGTATGTYTNTPTLNQPAAVYNQKAVAFTAASSHYVTTAGITTGSVSACTISVWIKPSGNQTAYAGIVYSSGSGSNKNGLIFSNLSGLKVAYSWNDDPLTYNWTGGPTLTDGVWSHVVLVISSTNALVYVNGVLVATNNTSHITKSDPFSDVKVSLNSNVGSYFNGTLADVRIWTRALTASDIMEVFLDGATDIGGLIGNWKLDELGGLSAIDSSGNGYNGTYQRDARNTTLSGRNGMCYSPNTTSDYITTSVPTTTLPSSGTIALWVKGLVNSSQALVAKGVNDQIQVMVDAGNVTIRNGVTAIGYPYTSYGTLTDWHHLLFMWSSSFVFHFKDGVFLQKANFSAIPAATAKLWRIGQFDVTLGGYYLKQPIDDVRIYNRMLSYADIKYLYNLTLPDYNMTARSPVTSLTTNPVFTPSSTYPYLFRSRTL